MTVVNKAESFLPAIEQNARDHQVLIVEGFRNLFSISALRPQKISGLEIIGEATDGLDAVQQIKPGINNYSRGSGSLAGIVS